MAKVKQGLIHRIKVAFNYVCNHKSGHGLVEQCCKCNSFKIIVTWSRENKCNQGIVYHAHYKCLKCGSVAIVKELWGD